jgi:hypothetical protein
MAQINKPNLYFNTKLYTGNDGTGRSITGVGFQPDFVWVKDRSNAYEHGLFDAIRGVTKALNSNDNTAEDTISNSLTAFGSDGFTVGSHTIINGNNNDYASWNWLASNTTASNTDGSITSTVSANTTSGFSIVSYTGTGSNATVGHGLGVAPSMIIFKRLVGSGWNWTVYHKSMGNNYFMSLNLTNAKSNTSSSTYFQDTTPTSSVFSIGDSGHLNGSDVIAYCFAEKKGFSKFGSYTGNGNADGTFIYTGFKPAFVMFKGSSFSGENWDMYDNKRETFNVMDTTLKADSAGAESSNSLFNVDFLSNGIKLRNGHTGINQSGSTYIYMAFAEEPLVGDNPATAR